MFRIREIHLFRLRVICPGNFSNTSPVALRCPLATDSFISLFIFGRGDLSNIDAGWKCGISDDFWSVCSSLESERFGMSQLNVICLRDFSDQIFEGRALKSRHQP